MIGNVILLCIIQAHCEFWHGKYKNNINNVMLAERKRNLIYKLIRDNSPMLLICARQSHLIPLKHGSLFHFALSSSHSNESLRIKLSISSLD